MYYILNEKKYTWVQTRLLLKWPNLDMATEEVIDVKMDSRQVANAGELKK